MMNELINLSIMLGMGGAAIYIILGVVSEIKEESIREKWFYLIKGIGYGVFALYLYKNSVVGKEVDVITTFTFILAFFEGVQNILSSLGEWLIAVIKLIIKH